MESLAKTATKLRNLQIRKTLNTDSNKFFSIPFKIMCISFLWDMHSLKNNSTVSRFGYSYEVNQNFPEQVLCFTKLKVHLWNIEKSNNTLLSKFRLKYLVYCQVFCVEVRCLQDQCISIWALVFHDYTSNNLPRENTVIQM